MIKDIIDAMEAKRSERLPITLSHEELLEVLEALKPKEEAAPAPVEVKPAPRRRSKSAKKGKK